MKFRFLIVFIVIIQACSPSRKDEFWKKVIIQPLDGSQTITIFTIGDKRYILDGLYEDIPDNNYILLDISNVDSIGCLLYTSPSPRDA